jgi:hypothetical protein
MKKNINHYKKYLILKGYDIKNLTNEQIKHNSSYYFIGELSYFEFINKKIVFYTHNTIEHIQNFKNEQENYYV